MASKIVKGLSRRQDFDKPMIVFLSLIGNDVCNGHYPTEPHMTKPEEFRRKTFEILEYLDTILPSGSNVIISGLADGRVMWDMLGERTHPLGEYRNDATYPDFYKYLDCLQVSPCAGWMSADPEIRNMTSERAANLSAVYEDIGKGFNKVQLIIRYKLPCFEPAQKYKIMTIMNTSICSTIHLTSKVRLWTRHLLDDPTWTIQYESYCMI